ncbi:MAG: 4'-phosphopantetheinyl transferase superfamily protein [Oscillatoriales cyanobacterium C42_A2020_001]|nr:4'-phosphopantetheinyl transferase superfamily protein [Leptolyngbyaceae cyanobacterium C42_A2020_001]
MTEAIDLSRDGVHLWAANLRVAATSVEGFFHTLAEVERQRASRFRFEQDRNDFVVARGILRSLLGTYLDLEPAQVQFTYGDRGKPELANHQSGTQFNVSHSNGMALYAIGRDRMVGVDLEYRRPLSDLPSLAKRFFSNQEYAVLTSLDAVHQSEAFFQLWTCKEAYLKATGQGLTRLDQAELNLDPSSPFKILGLQAGVSPSWSLIQLQPFPGFIAALSVQGCGFQLSCYQVGEKGAIAQ